MNSAQANRGNPVTDKFKLSLKSIKGTEVGEMGSDCQVCFDKFKDEDNIYILPCKHLFHEGCILPWFTSHDTCPVCRMEMPKE